jgi:glycosyltransferase involved in cell wall biosynthesis
LKEQVIYYHSPRTGIKLLDKFLSHRKYNRLYRNAIREYVSKNGKPERVHVHVAMKAGLAALWMKKKWNIPFIVTEHWGAYLAEADIRLEHYSFIYRRALRQILEQAVAVTVVSDHLGKAIQKHFPAVQYQLIPNVVDKDIFFPAEKKASDQLRLVHVSNMNYQKNTEAILQALKLLNTEMPGFEMELYGPVKPVLQQLVSALGLQNHVFFKGEVPQAELAKAMQQADALILYSRFETFGCVLIEANACGIPVIVSDIEVLHELVRENVNGVFVKGDDPEALAKKIITFSSEKDIFNKTRIAAATSARYNYAVTGRQFLALYMMIRDTV